MKKYLLILALALTTAFSYGQDNALNCSKALAKSVQSGQSDWKFDGEEFENNEKLGTLTYTQKKGDHIVFKILYFKNDLCIMVINDYPISDLSYLLSKYNTYEESYVRTDTYRWVSVEKNAEAIMVVLKSENRVQVILKPTN
jgi:hypothetical protein